LFSLGETTAGGVRRFRRPRPTNPNNCATSWKSANASSGDAREVRRVYAGEAW